MPGCIDNLDVHSCFFYVCKSNENSDRVFQERSGWGKVFGCSGVQVFGCSGVPVGTLVHWYIGMLVDFRIWQRIGKNLCSGVPFVTLLYWYICTFAHLAAHRENLFSCG
jgi:hypothetical protein